MLLFVKNKGTRRMINVGTSPFVPKSFVQALIVFPIVRSKIVLLTTPPSKRAQGEAQQVTLLKFDLMVQ